MTWILPKQLHTLACALDTAALSLDLNEQSQVCAQSLFVRSKPSQLRIWSAKWKRDSWTQHLSGRILRPSLGQRFATEWTSSLGATHASPSVQPANVKVSKTRGIFGRLLQMAFDFSNPSAASLRTSKDISAWGCPTSSKTWQEWVIERRGAYSQRLNAERHTRESGSSSWPTAATRDYKGQSGSGRQERKGHPADTLPNAMAQWPSPVASEVRQGFQDRSRGMKGSQESLTTVVIKSWPTPSGMDGERPQETQEQWEQRNARKKSANPNLGQLHRPLTVAVTAMHGPPVPVSSSTDGSRPGLSEVATRDGNWTTPAATDTGRTTQYQQGGKALSMQVWQTATVSTGAHKQKDGSMTDKLDQQVKNWATPRAEHDSGAHKGKPDTLHSQIKSWPTPSADGDSRPGANADPVKWQQIADAKKAQGINKQLFLTTKVAMQQSGKLNPRWVETLMGLPVGWTMPSCASPVTIERMSSDYSVTVLSQQQQNELSGL